MPLKLGKKPPGKVEKLIHNQKEQKQELERKDALIKDLEGKLDQLEQKESEKVAQLRDKSNEIERKFGEACEEVKLLQMNQANINIVVQGAKDYRDDELDNYRCTLNNVLKTIASGSTLDPKTVDKVKEMIAKTPTAGAEEPEKTPMSQPKALASVQQEPQKPCPQASRNVLKSRKVLTPDNVQCCEYYSSLNDKTDDELVWHVIGDKNTD